ncbi:HypA-like protein [Pleurostoma richardsiae]|uniref:HypA-like protein n=1 Tax=Pleurostoma richardsiae TaxID=41990 RepID=A0AA38VF61_9PEZI|nr:HypA-like protein [Pleurostoma richardsiae]
MVLALYGLGASASTIRKHYAAEQLRSKPIKPHLEKSDEILAQIRSAAASDDAKLWASLTPKAHTGVSNYAEFLRFLEDEIDTYGWKDTVNKYLFSGSAIAEDMFVRFFGGYLHPYIHLGYGIEFEQPAIVAEALAQTASHITWQGDFLLPAEEKSKSVKGPAPFADLLAALENDDRIKAAVEYTDPATTKGLIAKEGAYLAELTAKAKIPDPTDEKLEEAAASITTATAYMACAAQRADRHVKIDFILMHGVNSNLFTTVYARSAWIDRRVRARILEWKARIDLFLYCAQGSPALHGEDIRDYAPKVPGPNPWTTVVDRTLRLSEDGHVAKMVRALAAAERDMARQSPGGSSLVAPDDWARMANMVIDGAEAGGVTWIRGAGFDDAWTSFVSQVGPRPLW